MIYFDNAATTLKKPDSVIAAVVKGMSEIGNSGRGVHESSLQSSRVIYQTRAQLAALFNGESPKQIVFTSNATESLNMAIRGLIQPGDHVITTALEHNSVLRPLYLAEERGTELTICSADQQGRLDYAEIARAIRPETTAIVVTHASNLTGNVTDLAKISQLTQAHQLLLIVDGAQTAGIIPINVQKYGIDVLCFTGHKSLLGPQGTGGLYVKDGVQISPLKVGGSGIDTYNHQHPLELPTALEAGTLNGHGIAGLHAALSYIDEQGMACLRQKELALMWQFYQGVRELETVTVYGDFSRGERCPIVSLNVGTKDSSEVSDQLAYDYGIATRSGGHCAPLMHQALGTKEQGVVRFSFSHFNTAEEVTAGIAAVRKIATE